MCQRGFSQVECNEIATSRRGAFGGFGGVFLNYRYSQICPLPPIDLGEDGPPYPKWNHSDFSPAFLHHVGEGGG